MSDNTMLVLVAGYHDLDRGRLDFDALADQVRAQTITLRGAALVAKDADGNATLVETGDHAGRKGAGWSAAVGPAVGLFAPPMLAATVVGAGGRRAGRQVRPPSARERFGRRSGRRSAPARVW